MCVLLTQTPHMVDAHSQHVIKPAEVEAVGEAEQQEAWHKHLSTEADGQRLVEVYRKLYLQWLRQPMAPSTAYLQRACMHLQAKCYLQVAYITSWLQEQSCGLLSWNMLVLTASRAARDCALFQV